jgi:alpha/beta superfamily hydrolase
MNMPANTKPWVQGAVVGAAALAIIGFSWGGWMTGGTAAKDSVAASHTAVIAALAPICVERFRGQSDAAGRTAALIKTNSWERESMIQKSGFATMPGSTTADSDVAGACAEILVTPEAPKR